MVAKQRTYRCALCGIGKVSVPGQACWHCLDELEASLFADPFEDDPDEAGKTDPWLAQLIAELTDGVLDEW